MIKNYLKVAWRNLTKNKTFSLLNIIGLSVAFGAAILLSMTAFFELSYDKFHKNIDAVYQIYHTEQTPKGAVVSTSHPEPLAITLKEEVPGIQSITRHLEDNALVIREETELNLDGVWVDKSFFSMFSLPVLEGDKNTIQEKSSVAITQEASKRVFGDQQALGKTLNILVNGEEKSFRVSSILKNIPENSSLDFDIAINFENHGSYNQIKGEWDDRNHNVYVQLDKNVLPKSFENNTAAYTKQHFSEEIENAIRDGAVKDKNGNYKQLKLLPFKDISFATFRKGVAKVDKTLTYLIFGVALLILIIACVNFTNMSIANSTQRLKEFGMRKTLGAPKKQLFLQLWIESLLVFLASVGIGLLLSVLFLDSFKTMFNTNISFQDFNSLQIVLGFMAMVLLITFISGGYPALLMTRIGTIQALKGKLNVERKPVLRNALITVQFGISILLISGTLVLWKQLDFMRTKDLGYNKEYVISFPLNGKKNSYEAVQLLRNELKGNPNILNVSASNNTLGRGKDGSAYTSILGFDYKGRGAKTNMLVVDHDYIETLDLELIKGRGFDRAFAADSLSLVINETMAKSLNEEDPLAINIMMDDSVNYKVIGVLKDYHFEKLNRSIAPITLFMNKEWEMYYAYVKVVPKNISASFDLVQNAYARVEPNAEFLGSFLNENVDRTFRRERELTTMITSGSCIAIVLSCIGLFAMSLLVVTQRTKEIGIRKVIGANIASITYLLIRDFLKLVIVGFLIASPLAWWLSKSWLEDYAYRTNLSIWTFLVPGAIALFIALLTISAKTLNAALQNPTKSLRTE